MSRSRSSPQLLESNQNTTLSGAIAALRVTAMRWATHERESAALPLVAATLVHGADTMLQSECDAFIRMLLKSCANTKLSVARGGVQAFQVLLGGSLKHSGVEIYSQKSTTMMVVPPTRLPLRGNRCSNRLEVIF